MAWGIVMSFFMVAGMLVLIFAEPKDVTYMTFGEHEINPPSKAPAHEPVVLKKAA